MEELELVTVLDIFLLLAAVVVGFLLVKINSTKRNMEKIEKVLKDEQVFPECSDVTHGIVISNNKIEEDDKPALSWISRLAG